MMESALVPKIMLQFQNPDTSWHQGDDAAFSMLRTAFSERFLKNSPKFSYVRL